MTSNTAVVEGFYANAARVARSVPTHRAIIQWFERRRFRLEMAAFVSALYALDTLDNFEDEELLRLEKVVRFVLSACEISEDAELADSRRKLRAALDGIESGFAPNPAKRPSQGEILAMLNARLESAN